MQLHVFARRPYKSHVDVEVKDDASVATLKRAIIVTLKLDTTPDCVRLLREVEGGAPVLLHSCEKLADQGVFEGSKVVVDVMAPEASALFGLFCISLVTLSLLLLQHTHTYTHTTALEIRLRMPKGQKAETMIQNFTSAAEFERFLVGCKLYHMRTTKGGDKHIAIITELDQAVAVSKTVGDFLMLDDPTVLLLDDVSNLKSFRTNMAGGFEELSNRAIAINKDLLRHMVASWNP